MNLKKNLVKIIAIILFAIFAIAPAKEIYATEQSPAVWMGLVPLMTHSQPNLGYSINKPGEDGAAQIWNIVKYQSAEASEYTDANIYCVKAGVGFTSASRQHDGNKKASYDRYYDMKTERTNIAQQNTVLSELVSKTITESNLQYSRYNALLALLDRLYLPGESTENERKELIYKVLQKTKTDETYNSKLENMAGAFDLPPEVERDLGTFLESGSPTQYSLTEYALTEDDINAVQQAAIWYFTNHGEESGKYDKTDNNSWLYYSQDGVDSNYNNLSNYKPKGLGDVDVGPVRNYQAEVLYKYLIQEAKTNASSYAESSSALGSPIKVNKKTLTAQTDGSNYIVGPLNIEQVNSREYTIELKVTNGSSQVNYTLLNGSKQQAESLKSLVGKGDFYIRVPANQADDLSITINTSYNQNKMKLWASNTNDQEQPLVEVNRVNVPDTVVLKLQVEKPFDLALRKYITEINGKSLTELGKASRVPVINNGTISTNNTATYNHKKDPVIISTNDIVTYSITIYNEGQKAGRATKIVDQLPTGLIFDSVKSGKFVKDTYDPGTNKLTLKRADGNQDNLDAYNGSDLKSETIEIKCKVTATPDTKAQKILTNVAWIAEEVDATVGTPIVNDTGADIDSEPGTTPKINNADVNKDNMTNYTGNGNKNDLTDSGFYYKGQQDDDDFEKLVLLPETFDLKLIKFITEVNGEATNNRVENVDVSKLNTLDANGNMVTTAKYTLEKNPVAVAKGDIVTYTFRIYNEGTIDGYAEEITEDVPDGLEFVWSDKTDNELDEDTTFTEREKEAIKLNQNNLWGSFKYDAPGGKIIQVSSNYLSRSVNQEGNLIQAFGRNDDGTKTTSDIHYKELKVAFKVVSDDVPGTIIRNEAEISEDADSNGKPIDDRDSDTEQWKKNPSDEYYDEDKKWPVYGEDDEDYDNIVLKAFDLSLRKFIIAVSDDETISENEYLKNSDGSYLRAPKVDTSKLNATDENGKMITTATYNHPKTPVEVEKGDLVIYMLRVYNEGDVDGYAAEIKDHLPPYLEFVDNSYNRQYGWIASEDGRTVTTKYLENEIITKAVKNANGYTLSYKEVPIMCKVTDEAKADEPITNIADITKYLDENKESAKDRDSEENNVVLPSDENLPEYKDDETGSYVPGQEDDDDFEKVVIKPFDLALRKFITKIEDRVVDSRIPQVNYDKENDQITYEHGKDPLTVVSGNVVEYTIRIFNEGARNGYAAQVLDDIPDGLVFLPDNATNTEYRWTMYRKLKDGETATGEVITQDDEKYIKTTNPEEAEVIVTDYLSKEQGEDRMKNNTDITENPNLLKAFNKNAEISDTNPDFKDVKVAFRVVEPNSSDRVIVNSAQISEDTDEHGNDVDDEDSEPGKWNEGEDDQDKEYIELREFDLALRKWVTQAIVIDNGKQTVTQTGHKPYDDPEQVVKVEIVQSRLNKVTVKFRYSIRVINEGDIEGYAKEVTDYVPKGLKFVAADNPGWKDEGNNIISTRLLENKLLKPGEYADVEVVLTWINGECGLGTVMTNKAEISEDDNPYDVPDKDSTPDNKKDGEDDIDDAPVILSIKTGQIKIYFTLGFIILLTTAAGIVLIKKYVL